MITIRIHNAKEFEFDHEFQEAHSLHLPRMIGEDWIMSLNDDAPVAGACDAIKTAGYADVQYTIIPKTTKFMVVGVDEDGDAFVEYVDAMDSNDAAQAVHDDKAMWSDEFTISFVLQGDASDCDFEINE